MTPTRRDFLHGAAAAGAVGAAVSAGFRSKPARARSEEKPAAADVCVVGAGYAGLTAALRLKQSGAKVVLLEAQDRPGGRSWTQALPDGGWIDLGGQWVGPTQDRFYALISERAARLIPRRSSVRC